MTMIMLFSIILDLGSLDLEEGLTGSRRRAPQDFLRNSESEPVSPKASTSDSDAKAPNWRGFFRILKKGPQMPFQTFPPLITVPKLTRRKSKRIREELVPQMNSPALTTNLDSELSFFKASWKNFSLSELQVATDNFSKGQHYKLFSSEFECKICYHFDADSLICISHFCHVFKII